MKKNFTKRVNFKKLEKKNLILKLLSTNKLVSKKDLDWASRLRYNSGKNSSISLIRNNCTITGRNRGVIPSYGLSRIEFKRRLLQIPGIRKC